MKLVRVEHIRCGDYDDSTYVWVDDDVTEDQVQETVDRVAREYLTQAKDLMGREKPQTSFTSMTPNWKAEKNQDRTVREVMEEFEAEKQKAKSYESVRQKAMASFGTLLAKEEGFHDFYDREPDIVAEANWGHNHGTLIEYGGTRIGEFRLLKMKQVRTESETKVYKSSEEPEWV